MSTNPKAALPKIDAKIQRALPDDLLQWYATHRRDLPWRRDPSPYHITISEFMCQQTQIATVLPYYQRWLKSFPHWQQLAAASDDAVLKHWEGLGYYRRAKNLHRLAQLVVRDYQGELPQDTAQLQQLPGIGPYTAAAIASIAYGMPAAVLDGNVIRVLTRIFALPWNVTQPAVKQRLQALATRLLPDKNCGDYNQALMELGALVCTPRNPQCLLCPLATLCRADTPERFPHQRRVAITKEQQQIALIVRNQKIWLLKPELAGRWHGFYRLPLLDPQTMHAEPEQHRIKYSITRYRVSASIHVARFKTVVPQQGCWLPLTQLAQIALPAPHRKALQHCLSAQLTAAAIQPLPGQIKHPHSSAKEKSIPLCMNEG